MLKPETRYSSTVYSMHSLVVFTSLLAIAAGLSTSSLQSVNSTVQAHNELPIETRCTLLVLQGHTTKAAEVCELLSSQQLDKVVQDTYSSRLENVDKLTNYISLLPIKQQLHGYSSLLQHLRLTDDINSKQAMKIVNFLRDLDYWLTEDNSAGLSRKNLLELKNNVIPQGIRQIFWNDWCVITNSKRLYEYLYISGTPDQIGKVRTFTKGDGYTQPVGHWALERLLQDGQVRFQMRNRAHERQYLSQSKNSSDRIDCDQRSVITADLGVCTSKVSRIWELEPHFKSCSNCFKIKNAAFTPAEYIYTPPDDLYYGNRNIRSGSTNVIQADDDIWEFRCWEGDRAPALINHELEYDIDFRNS